MAKQYQSHLGSFMLCISSMWSHIHVKLWQGLKVMAWNAHYHMIDTYMQCCIPRNLTYFLNCSHFEGFGGHYKQSKCVDACVTKYRIIERTILLSLPNSVGKKGHWTWVGIIIILSRHPMGWAQISYTTWAWLLLLCSSKVWWLFSPIICLTLLVINFWWQLLSILQNVLTKNWWQIFGYFTKGVDKNLVLIFIFFPEWKIWVFTNFFWVK
jgi:hypothetical protein